MSMSNESLAGVNALHFIECRGWKLLEESFKNESQKDKPTTAEIVEPMLSTIGYWTIIAETKSGDLAAILVVRQQSLPEFRKIIQVVLSKEKNGRKIGHLVLVTPKEMVADQKFRPLINSFTEMGLRVEMISNVKLATNLPKLPQVPQQSLMPKEEVEAFLAENRVKLSDLPSIKTSDAMVIWLGAVPGDVVKVIRDSETSCQSISMRHVVN